MSPCHEETLATRWQRQGTSATAGSEVPGAGFAASRQTYPTLPYPALIPTKGIEPTASGIEPTPFVARDLPNHCVVPAWI